MAEEITGYELSRNWFDWCFENPEKIKPNHTAMYFFIIEHWNRLGQKDKFGLPMEMTKDAIGIKNYKTYSNTFEDLIDWGFIKILQRSKNQYSANVIALSKNTKANTKALSKATQKHSQKQVQSIVGIDKPNNLITLEPINKTWRESFEIYRQQMYDSLNVLFMDMDWVIKQEKFNPNIDISLSIEKSIENFWGTEAGWKNKKAKKTNEINWRSTFQNAITLNKVYRQNGGKQQRSVSERSGELDGIVSAVFESKGM